MRNICKTYLANHMNTDRPLRLSSLKYIELAIQQYNIVIYSGGSSPEDVIHAVGATLTPSYFDGQRDLIVSDTKNKSVASSSDAHPPHTDGVYIQNPPSDILLHCIRTDMRGGGSGLFWYLKKFYERIPEKLLRCLCEYPVHYQRCREDGLTIDSYEGPILIKSDLDHVLQIRWRYDTMVRPKMAFNGSIAETKLFDEAIAFTNNYFQTEPPIKVPYRNGDIIVFSNRYLIHGRSQILDSKRHMRRIWLTLPNYGLSGQTLMS